MRTLNTMELTEIQGGNLAVRVLSIVSNIVTTVYGMIDLTKLVVQTGEVPVYENMNQMGDYSN
jgi:hypothetical protein